MSKKEKIIGIITTSFLFLCVVFLVIFTSVKSEHRVINGIIIQGANFLQDIEYLRYSRINKGDLSSLTLYEIRQKFLSHKYVKNSDVELNSENMVVVTIQEKNFIASLISDEKHFLVNSDKELVGVLPNTNTVDLPAITNVKKTKNISGSIEDKKEIGEAIKIIRSARQLDDKLYGNLSEINMRDGGEIVLTFSNLSMPVFVGRNNYTEKLATLAEIENNKEQFSPLFRNSVYLDLRYAKNVFIGYNEIIGIN
ncbi:MAG TPA: cell division protein FtsQ/DivIB [Ignavibacteriaceae bacterium]|nr:cell division protein FtsQ/DivIB [Ignavibacteriaceae bacterium]